VLGILFVLLGRGTRSCPPVIGYGDILYTTRLNKMNKLAFVSDEKKKNDMSVTVRMPRPIVAKKQPVLAKGKRGSNSGIYPPAIEISALIKRQTLRFETTAAVSGANGIITATDIFGALGVVGKVTNTSAVALATSFRLRRVTIWPSASSSAGVVAAMSWASDDDHDPDRRKVDFRPAGMVGTPNSFSSVPPKNSLAGFWMRDTVAVANVALFYVDISGTGSVLDLELDWTLSTDETTSQTITVSTAVVGKFYRLYLNRVAGANTLKPVEFTATL
jgi:hypothetical protein